MHDNLLMRGIVISLIVLGGLASLSCNGLRVHIGNTVPPDFTFNAGRFAECCTDFRLFVVFEEGSDRRPLWRIASKTIVKEQKLTRWLFITASYPRSLSKRFQHPGSHLRWWSGKTYLAVAGGTSYVPWARVKFMVKDNRIVILPLEPGDLP